MISRVSIDAMARYRFLKPFYEAGLARALCEGKSLQLERQYKTFYAVVKTGSGER